MRTAERVGALRAGPFVLLGALLAGCTNAPKPEQLSSVPTGASAIHGTASYRERIVLPSGAIFEAELLDASGADTSAVVGRTRVESPRVPIAFEIFYPASAIDLAHHYSVRAWISSGGVVKFSTDSLYPVITHGHGTKVELKLRSNSSK